MDFKVKRMTPFAELQIDFGEMKYSSGLLNDDERKNLALDFLNMLGDLLPASMKDFDDELTELVNKHF